MAMKELIKRLDEGLIYCRCLEHLNDMAIVETNDAAAKILEIDENALKKMMISDVFYNDCERFRERLRDKKSVSWRDELYYTGASGTVKFLKLSFHMMEEREVCALVIILRDVSDEIKQIEKLRLFREIYENCEEGIMVFNALGKLEWANKTFMDFTQIDRHWVIGRSMKELEEIHSPLGIWKPLEKVMSGLPSWEGEIWRKSEELQDRIFNVKIFPVKGEFFTQKNYVVQFIDVTYVHQLNREIEYLAYRDKLTGAYNLRYLIDHFEPKKEAVMFYIDLDGFTKINDIFGHFHGDTVIKIVSSRLLGGLTSREQLARVGGDKFVVWGPCEAPCKADLRANQLLTIFNKPILIDGQAVRMSVNMGFVVGSAQTMRAEDFLKSAELASKQAKHKGLNRISAYDSKLAEKLTEVYRLDRDIKAALDREEFYLKFQPVVRTHSGEVAGFEVLARWKHSELGEISPSDFIPIAENNGAISAIGDWVLAESFNCLKLINELRESPIYGAINVSIRQLEQVDFVKRVKKMMDYFKIDGKYVEMEVTESVYMENLDAIFDNLKALNELGIRIAVDDFGTGFSSLSQLFRLDVSKIKIDKSFIDGLSIRSESDKMTEAITLIAKSLDLELVAEGVETHAQLEVLKDLNCDYTQGYLFSKPMNLGDFFKYLGLTEMEHNNSVYDL